MNKKNYFKIFLALIMVLTGLTPVFASDTFNMSDNENFAVRDIVLIDDEVFFLIEIFDDSNSEVQPLTEIDGGLGTCASIGFRPVVTKHLSRQEISEIKQTADSVQAAKRRMVEVSIFTISGPIGKMASVVDFVLSLFNKNKLSNKLENILVNTPDSGVDITFYLSCSNIKRGVDDLYLIRLEDVSI